VPDGLGYWNLDLLPVVNSTMIMEELCYNALDDDEDVLIDLNDPDCIYEVIEPVSLVPAHLLKIWILVRKTGVNCIVLPGGSRFLSQLPN
jgi:hypothetical protein